MESSTTNNKASIDTSSTSMIDRKRPPLLGRTGGTGLGLGLDEPIRISLTSSPYSDSTRSNRGPSPFTSGSTPNPLRSNPSTLSRVYNNSNSPSMGSTAAAARDPRTNSVWSTMTSNTAYTNISVHTIAENDTPSAPPATKTPGDTNKSLPPAPPEASVLALVSHNKGSAVNGTGTAGLLSGVESVSDRVAILNARLEALSHRRLNLTRSIKQMTELMPTDLLVASEAVIKKRELEKRKVEALRNELADVQREEYELGLKLHRAYKRLDRESEYERTTLWVRRVTD